MPFIAVPDCVMVEARAVLDGQHIENRIYVDCHHLPTEADLNAIATAVWTHYLGATTDFPVELELTEVVATSIDHEDGLQVTHAPGSVFGTDATGAMPNNVTLCLSLRTGFRGRSARGRLYWLGSSRDMVLDNEYTAPAVSGMLSWANGLIASIAALSFDWVIVSFRHNNVVRPGGPVVYIIDSVIAVDRTVDSQRRRLPGRGT